MSLFLNYLFCFRNLSRRVSCFFYKYSWSSFRLLYPTSRYFWCFFWTSGRWTSWWRTTPLWAWVPYCCSAWRSSARHSTLSLNPGKIHSCIVTLPLLHSMSLTPIVRPPLTLYGRLRWKRNLMHYPKTILGIWLLSLLESLWLVVNGSTRSILALMGPLSAIRLTLLQKVLHRSMRLIIKKPLLWLLVSYLFMPS